MEFFIYKHSVQIQSGSLKVLYFSPSLRIGSGEAYPSKNQLQNPHLLQQFIQNVGLSISSLKASLKLVKSGTPPARHCEEAK